MNENIFDKLDFGPLRALLDNDDITDISFDNNGQIWIRSLTQGSLRVEVSGATPEFVEKLAFQCSNVMGTTFNNAKPFLDAESTELRLNFVHPSIATNGIAMVIRKTPAKIRLEKEKLINEDYFTQDIHDILIKCVEGHCNIIVAGETGSGKTEFVKYLASHTKTNEKIITIEDTLELHLDKIFPQRDIVAMKTNNVASYTDVLVTCMRQNPKWILLSEVRSAEAVSAVRNSISSGHNILSTIHADKASAIPYRLYSLMETDIDVNQFLSTIYRYIQLGVHIRAYYSKERGKFHREVDEVVEFYVDDNNQPQSRVIYQKVFGKEPILRKPSEHLLEYLENQNIDITEVTDKMVDDNPFKDDPEIDEDESTTEEYEEEVEATEDESEEYTEIETDVEEDDDTEDNSSEEDQIEEYEEETDGEEESSEGIASEQVTEEVQVAIPVEETTQLGEATLDAEPVEVPEEPIVLPQAEVTPIVSTSPVVQQQTVVATPVAVIPQQPVIPVVQPGVIQQPTVPQQPQLAAAPNGAQGMQPMPPQVQQQMASPVQQLGQQVIQQRPQPVINQMPPQQQIGMIMPQQPVGQPMGMQQLPQQMNMPQGTVAPFIPPINGPGIA